MQLLPVLLPALVTGCVCRGMSRPVLHADSTHARVDMYVIGHSANQWSGNVAALHACTCRVPYSSLVIAVRDLVRVCAWCCYICLPASSLLGSKPSTSLPQEGQSRVCEMHERQNVCWQLLTLWASNRSPLQTGQCSVLSLGPLAVPKPRGHVAAAAGGVLSAAGWSLDAKGHFIELLSLCRAIPENGHPEPCMLPLLTVMVLLW